MERFGYFMVRLHHAADADARGAGADGERIRGVVERLASGEKRAFASGDELLSLLRGWTAARTDTTPPPSRG